MTKRELIQFMDELVELASEENKSRAMSSKIYGLDELWNQRKKQRTDGSTMNRMGLKLP